MNDRSVAFRNVVQQLQARPGRYRLFGVWWWPMKAMLKDAGYGTDQLYMLGPYQDPETAALAPLATLDEVLAAAFEEYQRNAAYPHPDGRVESPDGEMVTIWDNDASL